MCDPPVNRELGSMWRAEGIESTPRTSYPFAVSRPSAIYMLPVQLMHCRNCAVELKILGNVINHRTTDTTEPPISLRPLKSALFNTPFCTTTNKKCFCLKRLKCRWPYQLVKRNKFNQKLLLLECLEYQEKPFVVGFTVSNHAQKHAPMAIN